MIDDVAPDIRSLGVAVDEHDRVALSCLHVSGSGAPLQ